MTEKLEKALLLGAKTGIFLVPVLALVVVQSFFFPYISAKGFFFRIIIEIILGLYAGLLIINFKKYKPRFSWILAGLSVFVAVIALSAIFGVDPYHSFWSNFERMEGLITHLHLLAFFVMLGSVIRSEKELMWLFNISVFASIAVAGFGLFEYFGLVKTPNEGRIISTIGNPIYVAVYLLFHIFISAFCFLLNPKWQWRVFYAFAALIGIFTLFLTGTRGTFLGLVFGFVFFVILSFVFAGSLRKRIVWGIVLLILVGAPILLITFKDTSFVQSQPLLHRFASISLEEGTAQSRLIIWGMALDAWQERPVLGWGIGNFIIPYSKYYNPQLYGNEPWFDRVHNVPLEWLTTAGVVGFVAYTGIWASSFRTLYSVRKKNIITKNPSFIIASLFVAHLAQSLFVFDVFVSYVPLMMIFGFLHFLETNKHDEKEKLPSADNDGNIFKTKVVGVSVVVAVGIILAFFVNFKPMLQAKAIITAMGSVSQGKTDAEIKSAFDKAVSYNSFGTSEARERMADFIVRIGTSNPAEVFKGSTFVDLISMSIREAEKEVAYDPESVKDLVTLAKLKSIKASITGSGHDKSIGIYERAIDLAPSFVQSHLGLIESLLLSGKDTSDAIDRLTSLNLSNEGNTSAVAVYVYTGDYDNAWRLVEDMKSKDLLFARDYVRLGNAARGGGSLNEAVKFFELALESAKRYGVTDEEIGSLATLAELYAQLGEFDKARDFAVKLSEKSSKFEGEVEKFLQSVDVIEAGK